MTTGAARLARWESLGTEVVYPGITREVIHGERQTMVRYRYEPGAVFPVVWPALNLTTATSA